MKRISEFKNVLKKENFCLVNGIIRVPKGETLVLKGEDLVFEKDCALVIEGRIIAENTIFTSKKISLEKDGWPNAWLGLVIKGRGDIKNCIFENSITGIYILKGKVDIRKNKIRAHRYGIKAYGSRARIENNEFRHCNDAVFLNNSRASIKGNIMQNNGCGIYAYYSKANIKRNKITINEEGYKKKEYSGIYSYSSNINADNNIIDGPYLGIVSIDSKIKQRNTKIKSVEKFKKVRFSYESIRHIKRFNFTDKKTKIKIVIRKDFLSKEINHIFRLCIELKKLSSKDDKRYKKKVKEIEDYLNNNIWRLQPCLDIPFSYIANAYSICHNKTKDRTTKRRAIELGNYLEWWIYEVGGADTHQDLLASSALGVTALEFNNKKSKRWLELSKEVVKRIEKKDFSGTEAPLFLSDFKQYLEKSEI